MREEVQPMVEGEAVYRKSLKKYGARGVNLCLPGDATYG